MPNILAHVHVAEQLYGSGVSDVLLASAMPDFWGMHGDKNSEKKVKEYLSDESRSGISYYGYRAHKDLDIEYNQDPNYVKVTSPLTKNLMQVGLGYKASRLSAHFIADLMLDGALAERDTARNSYEFLASEVLLGETFLKREFVLDGLRAYVKRYFSRGYPNYYANPLAVATITHDRLVRTAQSKHPDNPTKYTFRPEQIETVADVVDLHTERVYDLTTRALQRSIRIIKV